MKESNLFILAVLIMLSAIILAVVLISNNLMDYLWVPMSICLFLSMFALSRAIYWKRKEALQLEEKEDE